MEEIKIKTVWGGVVSCSQLQDTPPDEVHPWVDLWVDDEGFVPLDKALKILEARWKVGQIRGRHLR